MKVRRVDWYPADWLEGTSELSYEEIGLYADICNLIYARGGPIGIDLVKARKKCRGDRVDTLVDRLVSLAKVTRNYDLIHVKRCDAELLRATSRIDKAELAASKRWKSKDLANASAESQEHPINHQPSINNQQIARANRASSADADFVVWWKAYPHKVGKEGKYGARQAYHKAHAKVGAAELLAGVERYIANKPADRPWCNGSTWLNQERWSDEWSKPAHVAPTASNSGHVTRYGPLRDPAEIARERGLRRQ